MIAGRPAWLYWLPAAAWALVIFALSAQPWLPGPPGGLSDKHMHALAFGLLALACLFGLVRGEPQRLTSGRAAAAAVLAVLYGLSDELHQAFVPGRHADLADLAADAVGAVVAVAAAWACAILLRRRNPRA